MKSSFIFKYMLAGGILLSMVACTPNPLDDLTVADSQVFITNYDAEIDFSQYATFGLADSVRVVDNNERGFLADNFSLALINQVSQNMGRRGYTQVAREDKPDLGVNITYIRQTQAGLIANPILWNDPFYAGYWGGGGFFYPTYYQYYEISESLWYVEMVDLKNTAATNNQPKVVWSAQVRGGGLGENPARMIDAIFAQSNYLRKQ